MEIENRRLSLQKIEDTINSSETSEEKKEREHWSGQLDFILSSVGYAVGIGNICRFPYLCYKNGGGAFLIPYLVFMVIGAVPIYYLEYGISQFSSSSVLTVWKICPLLKGVGYGALIVSGIFCVYINIFLTWILYFLYKSMTPILPWSHCKNEWNTKLCHNSSADNGSNLIIMQNTSAVNGSKYNSRIFPLNEDKMTASEEFWKYNVLQITVGIEDIGGIRLELLVCLAIAWLIIFLCLCKGIKSSGKIVYVTVTFPYIVLVIFLVRAVTLPGAAEGIKFFLIPKWHEILSTKVWGEAATQIFFSSGAGWGALLTFASFNKFHHNIQRDAIMVPIINSGTSIFAGFVTFSILGFMAHEKGMSVDDVVTQGPGLAFVAYPEAVSKLPISPLWAILFFLMMMTIAIDTQFGTFETITNAIIDEYPHILRRRKSLVTVCFCCIGFVLGLPFITEGGIYVLQIVDWYCGLFTPMIVATLECLVVGWIYGTDRFNTDIQMMIGYPPSCWWKFCWKWLTPCFLMMMLLFNMLQLKPVSFDKYQYPSWAIVFGWLIGMVSVVPIPLYIIKTLWCGNGTILQKFANSLQPVMDWRPILEEPGKTTTV
ncbi:sodium- and chloride-dependent glycine transporter 2-like [Mytilus galloprovincialis]|uniref:sodium- and chloride-dependent glycine transporter 2-like n=1 Tax=Mytilus galloprovincialis TaxID=29158 RepID=UPI003F7BDF3F